MKIHLLYPAAALVLLLLVALSTGGTLFYALAFLLLLGMLLGLLGVLRVARTLSVSVDLSEALLRRGEDAELRLTLAHRGLIPVAPILLDLAGSLSGRQVRLRDLPGREQSLVLPVRGAHVGVMEVGLRGCAVEDLLGFFRKTVPLPDAVWEVAVLPRTFDIAPLSLAPGDPGSEIMARATEDLSAPSDIRSYQPGDAMKKIHWKLSLRKGELMVRTFDEPILQEVLILMDCSRPPSWGHPRAEADIRDKLLETAASVFSSQADSDRTVHLPLQGAHPVDLEKSMGMPLVLDHLARVDFSEPDRFERVLMLESRRLRKVGCVVVIAARLNSAMVDVMSRMHRIGPEMRLYLVTFAPDDTNVLPLISRLRLSGIEVECLEPDQS